MSLKFCLIINSSEISSKTCWNLIICSLQFWIFVEVLGCNKLMSASRQSDDAIYAEHVRAVRKEKQNVVKRSFEIDSLDFHFSSFQMHFTCCFNHWAAQLLRNVSQARNLSRSLLCHAAECWCEILSEWYFTCWFTFLSFKHRSALCCECNLERVIGKIHASEKSNKIFMKTVM